MRICSKIILYRQGYQNSPEEEEIILESVGYSVFIIQDGLTVGQKRQCRNSFHILLKIRNSRENLRKTPEILLMKV